MPLIPPTGYKLNLNIYLLSMIIQMIAIIMVLDLTRDLYSTNLLDVCKKLGKI